MLGTTTIDRREGDKPCKLRPKKRQPGLVVLEAVLEAIFFRHIADGTTLSRKDLIALLRQPAALSAAPIDPAASPLAMHQLITDP